MQTGSSIIRQLREARARAANRSRENLTGQEIGLRIGAEVRHEVE